MAVAKSCTLFFVVVGTAGLARYAGVPTTQPTGRTATSAGAQRWLIVAVAATALATVLPPQGDAGSVSALASSHGAPAGGSPVSGSTCAVECRLVRLAGLSIKWHGSISGWLLIVRGSWNPGCVVGSRGFDFGRVCAETAQTLKCEMSRPNMD